MAFAQPHTRLLEDDGMDISPAPIPEDEMELEMDDVDDGDTQMQTPPEIDLNIDSDHSMVSAHHTSIADPDVEIQDIDLPLDSNADMIQMDGTGLLDLTPAVPDLILSYEPILAQDTEATLNHGSVGISTEQPVELLETSPEPQESTAGNYQAHSTTAEDNTDVTLTLEDKATDDTKPNEEASFEIDYDDEAELEPAAYEEEPADGAPEAVEGTDQHENDGQDLTKSSPNDEQHGADLLPHPDNGDGADLEEHYDGAADAEDRTEKVADDLVGHLPQADEEHLEAKAEHAEAVIVLSDGPDDLLEQKDGQHKLHRHEGHTLMVVYEELEISLFPPRHGNNSETFFLEEESLIKSPITDLFKGFREVLSEAVSDAEELEIYFDKLNLTIGEDNISASRVTLAQIIDLFVDLHLVEKADAPPLYLYLTTKTRFSNRLGLLNQLLESGQGISSAQAPDVLSEVESLDEEAEFPLDIINEDLSDSGSAEEVSNQVFEVKDEDFYESAQSGDDLATGETDKKEQEQVSKPESGDDTFDEEDFEGENDDTVVAQAEANDQLNAEREEELEYGHYGEEEEEPLFHTVLGSEVSEVVDKEDSNKGEKDLEIGTATNVPTDDAPNVEDDSNSDQESLLSFEEVEVTDTTAEVEGVNEESEEVELLDLFANEVPSESEEGAQVHVNLEADEEEFTEHPTDLHEDHGNGIPTHTNHTDSTIILHDDDDEVGYDDDEYPEEHEQDQSTESVSPIEDAGDESANGYAAAQDGDVSQPNGHAQEQEEAISVEDFSGEQGDDGASKDPSSTVVMATPCRSATNSDGKSSSPVEEARDSAEAEKEVPEEGKSACVELASPSGSALEGSPSGKRSWKEHAAEEDEISEVTKKVRSE